MDYIIEPTKTTPYVRYSTQEGKLELRENHTQRIVLGSSKKYLS